MGFFKDTVQNGGMKPMDHIDAGIDEDTEPDHRVVEFEVDIEPGQVGYLPRIYPRPHELHAKSHGERIGPPYAIVIDREAIVGALDPDMLAQVRTGKMPLGGDEPMVTVMLSSIYPPEVKMLCTYADGTDRYVSSEGSRMDLLATELQRLDARNVVRDFLFFSRRLRLGVETCHYAVGRYERSGARDQHHSAGGTPHRESYSGVKLVLTWIAVEL